MLRSQLPFFWLFALFVSCSFATLYTDPSQLSKTTYDFIIIGGGTAGSVVAARLSEISSVSILVIEAGLSNTGPDAAIIEIPFIAGEATGSIYDWNYTTTPQAGLNGRSLAYPRGYVLGGSSSINNMAYTRGSSDDYDRLATVSGDLGWSWLEMWSYIMKSEKWVAPYDNHDTAGQYNPVYHSTSGLLDNSLDGYPASIDNIILNTTSEFELEYPFNLDMNSGYPLGVGWLQSSIGAGARSSAATAYLQPAMSSANNLDVLIQTQATKLVASNSYWRRTSTPYFTSVEVAQGPNAKTYTFSASMEIILSAGTIGTAQLLMLSGIGNSTELKEFDIEPLVDLPDVGQGMQDQPFFAMQWYVNNTDTWDSIVNNATAVADALEEYEEDAQGIMASNAIANQIAWLRLPQFSSILREYGDPTSGPFSPHYEFTFSNGFVSTAGTAPTTGNYFTATVVLVSPTSRGSVTLTSSSPWDYPNIDPAFFSTDFDIEVAVAGVQSLQRFLSASAWDGYLLEPYGQTANLTTEAEIEAYARAMASSVHHPVGTAALSRSYESSGVVGPQLTVKNTEGLRIVDASIFPYQPGAHPQAAVYFIAERASDLIKEAHFLY